MNHNIFNKKMIYTIIVSINTTFFLREMYLNMTVEINDTLLVQIDHVT